MSKGIRSAVGPLMSFASWSTFVRALGLIDDDVSDREADLCFVCARMSVADPYSQRGVLMSGGLPFEGFLEALVRLAAIKGLPHDEEIAENGFKDAGEMVAWLRGNDLPALQQMLGNSAAWGEEPLQPIWRCVDHLICILIRGIEAKTAGANDLNLTKREMLAWWAAAETER